MPARPAFVPALEGVRGLAVGAVMLFHGGFSVASGGFLGVSTFFTLSGFLITRLLLTEWERTAAIDLARFWRRRVRRLLPPLVVTVAGVALLAPTIAAPAQLWSLPGDALASLTFVANWRFALAGERYADLFESPSLLLHCWSLGVEGQFYLLAPLAMRALLVRRARPLTLLRWVLAALALASVLTTIGLGAAGRNADRIYYGTDTRMLELLVGAALAAWLHGRATSPPRWTTGVGPLALAGTVYLWSVTTPTTPWIHAGGLGGYAIVSALLLLGALADGSLLQRLLAAPALCWLGRVSYAAYLYHWPVFLGLTSERVGLDGWPLFVLRTAVTLALAELSFRLLEHPVRRNDAGHVHRRLLATWSGGAVLALTAVGLQSRLPAPVDPFLEAVRMLAARPEVANTGESIRYAIFGDSTAYGTEYALASWTKRHPGWLAWRRGEITAGCGLTGAVARANWELEDGCDGWQDRWRVRVRGRDVELAIVQTVRWDVVEQRIPGTQGFTEPGHPAFDAFLLARMEEAVDLLTTEGAIVVWLLSPPLEPPPGRLPALPDMEPARVERYNELVRELVHRRPGRVALVDVASYFASLEPSARRVLRPDGIHVPRPVAAQLGDWLAPAVLAAYAQLRPAAHGHPVRE